MNTVLVYGGLAIVGYFLGKTLFKLDTRSEERKRRALTISTWAAGNGLPIVSKVLQNYAIDDRSGLFQNVREISDLLGDPDASKEAVRRFLTVQLKKQLETEEGRKELVAFVEKQLNVAVTVESKPPPVVKEN